MHFQSLTLGRDPPMPVKNPMTTERTTSTMMMTRQLCESPLPPQTTASGLAPLPPPPPAAWRFGLCFCRVSISGEPVTPPRLRSRVAAAFCALAKSAALSAWKVQGVLS